MTPSLNSRTDIQSWGGDGKPIKVDENWVYAERSVLGYDNGNVLTIRGESESAIKIFPSGNVGIGTHANEGPSAKLDVEGSIHVIDNIDVDGDVILKGGDAAEEFFTQQSEPPGPGTVVVIDWHGGVRQSEEAYDKKVAGIISGAGEYRPGIILDRQISDRARVAVALLGKVACKVDASYGAIEIGDLLTTSSTPGHAMKVCDPLRAFGTVIGKALSPLQEGTGLIPVLVALQ